MQQFPLNLQVCGARGDRQRLQHAMLDSCNTIIRMHRQASNSADGLVFCIVVLAMSELDEQRDGTTAPDSPMVCCRLS